jgi:FHA domain
MTEPATRPAESDPRFLPPVREGQTVAGKYLVGTLLGLGAVARSSARSVRQSRAFRMAKLLGESAKRSVILLPEHLIGRGPQCALRLADKNYVSSQHAVIRWSGNGWEALDRGSRNGTRLDGTPSRPAVPTACRRARS